MRAALIEREDGSILAGRAWCTGGVAERIEGWFRRKSVEPGEGLLIAPCSSIHTFGMNFDMDVLFLDGGMRVTKVVLGLKPNRFAWAGVKYLFLPWTAQALELPAGSAKGVSAGEVLKLRERAA